jgi:hypothetical protein
MSGKVTEWLDDLGLVQYSAVFEENDISWELIGDIDQETLKDIGIGSAGHRLQILKSAKMTPSSGETRVTLIAESMML